MLQSILLAALRNLARNKVTATINILGLALGITAALFIAIFAYDELSYDRFLRDYQDVYRLVSINSIPGQAPIVSATTSPDVMAIFRNRFQSVETVARLISKQHSLRRGDTEAQEKVYWADPDILRILQLPAIAGNAQQALDTPDAIVITRSVARKYFGTDAPLGQTLEIDRTHTLRVTAVLADLPSNTHLDTEIIASGQASFSEIARFDALPPNGSKAWTAFTYVKLRPGASAAVIESELDRYFESLEPADYKGPRQQLQLLRVDRIHLHNGAKSGAHRMSPDGSASAVYAISLVGVLVLIASCLNFINLMTAQAAQRACEVGVRKAAGASRLQLIAQFIGEMTLYAALATIVALMLVRLLFVPFESMIGRPIAWSFWTDPAFIMAVVGLVLVVGLLAGFYPALLLSSFRPAVVLKGSASESASAGPTRRALVIAQFAICIGLIIATVVIYRQTQFAMTEGLRLDKNQVLILKAKCNHALLDQIRVLAGVRAASCAMQAPFANGISMPLRNRQGQEFQLFQSAIDADFFQVYGLEPIAGRLFVRDRASDVIAADSPKASDAALVINEAAARRYAFNPPSTAVGQSIRWQRLISPAGEFAPEGFAPIIGVVPDFPMGSIEKSVEPTVYFIDTSLGERINIKLVGQQIPETLAAIDRLWKQFGEQRPIDRFFLADYVEKLYASVTRTAHVLAIFGLLALSVASIGLVGLAAFTARSRAREIGVRKAAGASSEQVLWLVLRQFTMPVIWGSLLAWSVSYYVMRRWLESFAYRIELSPWPFVSISVLTVVLAWMTVAPQAWRMAITRPSRALREE